MLTYQLPTFTHSNFNFKVRRSQLLAEKILKSISSAVYLSQHLLFSELTQPIKRTQKVNKDLTPSGVFGNNSVITPDLFLISRETSPFET